MCPCRWTTNRVCFHKKKRQRKLENGDGKKDIKRQRQKGEEGMTRKWDIKSRKCKRVDMSRERKERQRESILERPSGQRVKETKGL